MKALLPLIALLALVAASAATAVPRSLTIGQHERLLVVAPHPDDETLAAGGLIQRVLAHEGSVTVVVVTAGDGFVEAVAHDTGLPRPRPTQYVAYGERRIREVRAAVARLGSNRLHLEVLGFPDGGLRALLQAHWSRTHPERSPTTAVSDVPYGKTVVDPATPYDGSDLRRELTTILRETHPTIVALPDPLDKHPDHRATGLFSLLALRDWLRQTKPTPATPQLLAYLVHWPAWPPGWNAAVPPPDRSDHALLLPRSLPHRGLERVLLTLTPEEIAANRAALACYVTQQEVMPAFLAAFVRRTEPFTVFTHAQIAQVRRMVDRHLRARHHAPRREAMRSP